MRMRPWLVFAMIIAALAGAPNPANAGASALTGNVTSEAKGAMEGVLVSARRTGSPIVVTVVSDDKGHFSFPADRLSAGDYTLTIRAEGYELVAPQSAKIAADTPTRLDLPLAPVKDITKQLTSTEWFASMPGTDEDKRPLIECISCHTIERIVKSKYTSDEFVNVLRRMANYANNTTQAHIQVRPLQRDVPEDRLRKVADYLATINLSRGDTWTWPIKTLPRPKGRATKVIITEYDLPRKTIAPHDVRVDAQGDVWYSDFTEQFLGKLDPRTGETREFPYPMLKPGFPTGSLDMEPDESGDLWLAMMFQGGIAKFDVKTEAFKLFPVSKEFDNDAAQQSMVMPWRSSVDGKVWTNDVAKQSIMRVDLASGKYEFIDPFKNVPRGGSHAPYGLAADARNNLWFMDFGDENIVKIDAKTLRPTIYPTPTPRSRPRRLMFDGKRLWFAEFAANKLGMFDLERESYKEWDVPTPHSYPYDAFLDRNDDLWSGNMSSDRVLRMKPGGDAVEYLLPRSTNIRRIFVDNSTPSPTFWAGNNHGASIIKLEPLD